MLTCRRSLNKEEALTCSLFVIKQCEITIHNTAIKRSAWILSKCDFLMSLFMGAKPYCRAYLRAIFAKEKKFCGLQNNSVAKALKTIVRNSPVLLYPKPWFEGIYVTRKRIITA
jgi:hypothetical protein